MENKLLIMIMLDNSLAINEEKIDIFKKCFAKFLKDTEAIDACKQIEVCLISYNDFSPLVIKEFNSQFNPDELVNGKIPFFDRMLAKGLETLNQRAMEISTSGGSMYKPWILPIIDSKTFDNELKSLPMISSMLASKSVSYFPFKLKKIISPKLKDIERLRPFIEIKDYNFEGLFNWLFEMAQARITTPPDENIQLNKDAFKGWTTL